MIALLQLELSIDHANVPSGGQAGVSARITVRLHAPALPCVLQAT
jgi:hypothetical protein